MNQSVYIAKSIKTIFQASGLAALVPGGIIYGLQPAPVLRPFASMVVYLDGEPEYTTGPLYAQAYSVIVRVWSDQYLPKAAAIQSALDTMITANTKLASLAGNAWTLHCSLEPGSLEEQEQRLFGKYHFVAGARWLIQLQEERV
jgi:hypothetical protein